MSPNSPADLPIARLSPKFQAVIPKAIREQLDLRPGDLLRYRVEGGSIVIEPVPRAVEAEIDPFSAFDEWRGEADSAAYKDL